MSVNHSVTDTAPMERKEIQELVASELKEVEKSILDNFQSKVAMIPIISSYLTNGGGKRIRPTLVLLTSHLCGYNGGGRDHITYSTVVEYIHAATLLHDDVVDSADVRRGIPSANAKWGNDYSVLVGDYLFSKSFSMMSEKCSAGIIRAVSEATRYLAEGEVMQLVHNGDLKISEEKYLERVFRKTAALIIACCQIGAELGQVGEKQKSALEAFGKDIGIAFQLIDDLLDFIADEKTLGKPVGQDLVEGHITLPLIHTYSKATKEEKAFLEETVKKESLAKERMGDVVELIRKHDGTGYTKRMAQEYADNAIARLGCFEPSPYLDALKGIANYIVRRMT